MPDEADEIEQFLAAPDALRWLLAADAQGELDVLADGHVPEECVVLEDEADLALAGRNLGDVPAKERDATVVDFGESGDRTEEGALAAAAGPEEDEELAFGDGQRHVVDDRVALVLLGDLIEGDGHGLARIPARRSSRQL